MNNASKIAAVQHCALRRGAGLPAMVLAIAGLSAGAANAAPLAINFGGDVTQINFDPYDPSGGVVMVGSRLGFELRFDNAAADAVPDPNLGSYTFSGGNYGLNVGSGFWNLAMGTMTISVVDGIAGGPDMFAVYATQGVAGGLGDFISLSLLLQDDSGLAFSSDALPASLGDLSRFNIASFDLNQQFTDLSGNFVQYEVQGNVVPEPTTLALAFAGLAACAMGLRRPAPDAH